MPNEVRVAIFEFGSGGHFPNYLRLLFEYWRDTRSEGRLHAVVTNQFTREHATVFDDLSPDSGTSIEWSTISPEDEDALNETLYRAATRLDLVSGNTALTATRGATFMWSLVQKYGAQLSPRHILLTNIDSFVLPLSASLPAPADFSGILLRPIFHYAEAWAENLPMLRRSRSVIGRLFVERLFQHPQLRVTFFIDRAAMIGLHGRVRSELCYLPDPVCIPKHFPDLNELAKLRHSLGISNDRCVLLFFGDVSLRKGIMNVLDAIARLDPDETARVCLAIVGKASPRLERVLSARIAELQSRQPIEILRQSSYVSDSEAEAWFFACDLVLAPYLRQLSMSGIIILAAAHGRPVLSQDFGLIGELTRANGLGSTCDSGDVAAITEAIRAYLNSGTMPGWDANAASAFAKSHSHEQFAATIFSQINRFIT